MYFNIRLEIIGYDLIKLFEVYQQQEMERYTYVGEVVQSSFYISAVAQFSFYIWCV